MAYRNHDDRMRLTCRPEVTDKKTDDYWPPTNDIQKDELRKCENAKIMIIKEVDDLEMWRSPKIDENIESG